MPSLTPEHRRDEVTSSAFNDGMVNGVLMFIPSLAGLFLAMKNPKFRKLTNAQSRTAMAIMPPLFTFAVTGEQKLTHRMNEVASESEHNIETVAWAERQKTATAGEVRLHDLYRQSILNSGVRLVDTPTLSSYQKSANFIQSNPFKCIAAIGMPSVAYIFHGQGGKAGGPAEPFQMRILHTRVFGQFAVICTLIGVMSLKEVMDRYGRYITEDDIEARIQEMESTRTTLMTRAEYQNSLKRPSLKSE
mmetsp:Transcript_4198/g.9127  ORF Transcript_4198/g.9127 Transcript_4198/m.9127 type:complete len:247 (+) Transcript_4198:192-932(+)|eukprot:CAMPEP_0201124326 /NCGR_PEP_ID=MMETSP0850-20130426/11209_1 /ASSEMBLY_ACC=CAM_ASM_000622 /TAXON_ID=183588 /ORGANISM="Pseudo-nitzschia fraudulenta, Strain WWA7" /LENGTH=246 /DNA_ID=CAMNT_0047391567 /DNA_START=101 /DNA_END=841 /DNA_ORIENTATION=-